MPVLSYIHYTFIHPTHHMHTHIYIYMYLFVCCFFASFHLPLNAQPATQVTSHQTHTMCVCLVSYSSYAYHISLYIIFFASLHLPLKAQPATQVQRHQTHTWYKILVQKPQCGLAASFSTECLEVANLSAVRSRIPNHLKIRGLQKPLRILICDVNPAQGT